MKGISPIIASVLLIAITMSIAVVLAAYVTTYTREATEAIPSACIGGALFFTETSPTYDSGTCEITAGIEAQFVDLNGFVVQTDRGGVISNQPTTGVTELDAGDAGTVYADLGISPCPTDVDYVRVTTANCFNVRTAWAAPTVV
ncbi:MAG: type IV pilin [Candidatus Aenigmarchaeota archaeon]|nr:type IV pilin [Candidatus Aenigmarchaeota archaeon]